MLLEGFSALGPIEAVCRMKCGRGKLFYLQLKLLCLQLSFFAYSPLKPLLDKLSHCKQDSSNCKQKAKIASVKAPIVSKKAKIINCYYKSSPVSRKLPHL